MKDNHNGLNGQNNEELAKLYQHNKKLVHIRNYLCERNDPFVISFSKRFYRPGGHLQVWDIVQEGRYGFIEAVEHFEYGKGNLLTYSRWWIRQAIFKAISNQEREIRIPINRDTIIRRLGKEMNRYIKEYGHKPTNEQFAKYLGKEPQFVQKMFGSVHTPISLDDYLNDIEESESKGSVIEDTSNQDDSENVENSALVKKVFELAHLPETYEEIVKARFGFYGHGGMTLKEVGEIFDKTKEGIRYTLIVSMKVIKDALEEQEGINENRSKELRNER